MSKSFLRVKNSILSLYASAKKTEKQAEDDVDSMPQEHYRALKGAYKSFVVPNLSKADIDGYVDQAKLYVKALIESQLKEKQSTKITMTLWVRRNKPVKLAVTLDPEDVKGAQDVSDNICDNYIRVEIPFNSLMMEFFKGSDTDGLIQLILHISRRN